MKRLFIVLAMLLIGSTIWAQVADSLVVCDQTRARFCRSSIVQATLVSAPLFAGSLVVKHSDGLFYDRMAGYLPEKPKREYYLQYAPAVALLGMKAAGLEGRSTWPQMLVADACAVAFMGGAVELVKHTADVPRPDGTDRHSFPSGHTATAFMTATMLAHEYGRKYPWVAVAGYATASATGLMRITQNRHNLSDVMAGASIGIMATELGYVVSDLIFHKPVFADVSGSDLEWVPSFVGYDVSFNIPIGRYMVDGLPLNTSSGMRLAAEGAWYFTQRIGIGAQASYSQWRCYVADIPCVSPIKYTCANAGLYASQPLSSRLALTGKALAGMGRYGRAEGLIPAYGGMLDLEPHSGLDWKFGLSLDIRSCQRLTYSLGLVYGNMPPLDEFSGRMSTLSIDVRMAWNL